MISYNTISEAIRDLKRRGFTIDFNLKFDGMNPHETPFALSPEKFLISEVYRFEGDTDPDDEAVVYAIESSDGHKGVLVNGYGAYSDPVYDEMVKKLPIHTEFRNSVNKTTREDSDKMVDIKSKGYILAEAIKKHQEVIDDFRARIRTAVNEGEYDPEQQSKISGEIITVLNPLSDQLAFAEEEMKLLNNMTTHQQERHDYVQLGSVVVTDKDIFFVSASIERFDVNSVSMFGLSTKAPLYQAMKGKKKGDSFTYRDMVYTIKEIF